MHSPESQFRSAIADLDQRLLRGEPFSGHERNCLFLNTGGPRWATASHAGGFDADDDSRGVAVTDWDGDGDLDVWVTNRTAPMVRFFRNDTAARGDSVSVALRMNKGNRNGIGARVEVVLAGAGAKPLVRELRAGEGFLSQSTSRLHFGLGPKAAIKSVRVRWPGGTDVESFSGVSPGGAWLLVQGKGTAEKLPAREGIAALQTAPVALPPQDFPVAVPLAVACPLPRLEYEELNGAKRQVADLRGSPLLILLCEGACDGCAREAADLTKNREALAKAGIRVLALATEREPETLKLLDSLPAEFSRGILTKNAAGRLAHQWSLTWEIQLKIGTPGSFLLDTEGRLRVLFRGETSAEMVLAEKVRLGLSPELLYSAALPFRGTWIQPVPHYQPLPMLETLLAQQDVDSAQDFLRQNEADFSRSPRWPAAARLLALAMTTAQRHADAVPWYRIAVRADAEDIAAQNNLADALLNAPQRDAAMTTEALAAAEKAAALTNRQAPELLDTLARAQLAGGQRDKALTTAREALSLARQRAAAPLISALEQLVRECGGDPAASK